MKTSIAPRPRWIRLSHILFVAAALLLAGCLPKAAPPRQPFFYTLEYQPPAVEGRPLPETIRILPFAAAPAYEKRAILYQQADNRRQYFNYHRWLAAPAKMVGFLIGRDLAASGLFAGVVRSATPANHTCSLGGTIVEFLEDERGEPWRARIEVEIYLLDGGHPAQVLLQKRYQESEPLARHHPAALAAAMSKALGRISAAIARDVHAVLQARRAPAKDKR